MLKQKLIYIYIYLHYMGLGNCTRAHQQKLTYSRPVRNTHPTKCSTLFLKYLYFVITLNYMFQSSRRRHQGTKPKRHPIKPNQPLLLCFDSLIRRGSKHVGMFHVVMQYKYVRNTVVHFIGGVFRIGYGQCTE